jgi:hypothetical protein
MCCVFNSTSKFQCASGQCIDTTLLCDGSKDCNDGSDETVRQCSNMRYVSCSLLKIIVVSFFNSSQFSLFQKSIFGHAASRYRTSQ